MKRKGKHSQEMVGIVSGQFYLLFFEASFNFRAFSLNDLLQFYGYF